MTPTEPRVEQRFQTLEAAVLDLTLNVRKLVEALQVVGALTAEQHEQAVRQSTIEDEAEATKTFAQARYRRVILMQRLIAIIIAVVIPGASLLAYWSLTSDVNRELVKEQNDLTTSCELHNAVSVTIPEQRELALASAWKTTHPLVAKIHQRSADELAKGVVDCSIYKKVPK
jgi:hypothetical protein